MANQQNAVLHTNKVNARGKDVRLVTVYSPEKVTELSYQLVNERWIPYKKVVHTVQ